MDFAEEVSQIGANSAAAQASITPVHAKYFAHELSRHGVDALDRLSRALFDSSVDLNPHQIDASVLVTQHSFKPASAKSSGGLEY
jgi:hypothetical protein